MLVSALLPAGAHAGRLPEYDAVARSAPVSAAQAATLEAGIQQQRLVRPGTDLQFDNRFGVPSFLWASKTASSAGFVSLQAKRAQPGVTASAAGAAFALEDIAGAH